MAMRSVDRKHRDEPGVHNTVGKELTQYRHRLIHQEDEYNCRSGADPIVGVLAAL
jgi:hypothetical protein